MRFADLVAQMVRPLPPLSLDPETTALVLVDAQMTAASGWMTAAASELGLDRPAVEEAVAEFDRTFDRAVANAASTLAACRAAGIRPIHVRLEASAADGADMGRLQKLHGLRLPPGSPGTEPLPPLVPLDEEIVLRKTASGAFTGCALQSVLRNLSISDLIIVGFYTEQCVETTARDAADLGYDVLVVGDACAGLLPGAHESSLNVLGAIYARLATTEELLARLTSKG